MKNKEIEFEILRSNKNRLYLFIGIVCVVVLLITIIVSNTLARYRVTDSVPLINSEINYKVPDLNMVSLYVASGEGIYEEADIIPSSGYTLNTEQSYCGQSNNGEIVRDDTVSIVYENGLVDVNGISKKGTKCYLYFDVEQETSGESILANYTNLLTRSDFTTTVTDTTTGTIYYEDTTDGRTYYFAGNPTDNWVYFAGFYWRIIRITEDGSIRMIYSGDSKSGPVETGEATQIGTSTFNSLSNNNEHLGYMYTSGEVHGLGTSSIIKGVVDGWYEENLQRNYSSYLSRDAGFCGDRTSTTTNGGEPNDTGGTGGTTTYYGASYRLYTNKTPTFECPDETNDLYTVAGASTGNNALEYPIGLITADEVAYAGGVNGSNNTGYYLYTNQQYSTMSPCHYVASYIVLADVFNVDSAGYLSTGYLASEERGVRPVINLSPNVTISGSGTASDPYTVQPLAPDSF